MASTTVVRDRDITPIGNQRSRLDRMKTFPVGMASRSLTLGSAFILAVGIVASCLALSCITYGQVSYAGKTIHIHDLPSLTARSTYASDVLAAALETVFNDKEVCCGKNSALEDSLQSSDPGSLKDIARKLQGKHLLSDGRAIVITAEFLTPDQVTAGHLIHMLAANHAPVMVWNSHLYVVNGVSYVENFDAHGGVSYVTDTFFLWDTRFSDSRREVFFDRKTEDSGKIQGLLFLQAASQ
jgi:hypothetical protein